MIGIILSRIDAEQLRGKYSSYQALDPVELNDGTFYLPQKVMDDLNDVMLPQSKSLALLRSTIKSVLLSDFKTV